MNRWIINQTDADLLLMSSVLKIDTLTANIIANRNIRSKNTAIKFLNPNLKYLSDIHMMKDMDKAHEIITNAIQNRNKIMIFGDYDVDGVMSTVILFKTLKQLGADVKYTLPSRFTDGFGLNMKHIKKFHDDGIDLLVTCDNGIAAVNEIAYAKKLGMTVIIFDHHEPDILPIADAIVDPKQQSCNYPFKKLCAAGICLLFAKLLLGDKTPGELFAFGAIGTLCDVVDLLDDNRILARLGLDIINNKQFSNPGLSSLLQQNKLHNKMISATDIGFVIGPCINACGRLKSAMLAANLFLDDENANEIANEICELNSKRKELTRHALNASINELSETKLNSVIVHYSEQVSESVAGIVAGRLKEKLCRPVIFFTPSNDEGVIKASARSVKSYNIFEELLACQDLFVKFGGHAMAAGISMPISNLKEFSERINSNCKLNDFFNEIYIDAEINFDIITYSFAEKLNVLAPFGHQNPQPLFLSKDIRVIAIKIIEDKDTIIFTLENNKRFKAIAFGMLDNFIEKLENVFDNYECAKILNGVLRTSNLLLDIVYNIEVSEFNGDARVELRLVDLSIKNPERL